MARTAVASPGPRWPWVVLAVSVTVAVAAVAWALSRPVEQVEVRVREPDPGIEGEIRALEDAVAERDAEVTRLLADVAELEGKLETARRAVGSTPKPTADLVACLEERDRLAEGLERAVEELNRRRITVGGVDDLPPRRSARDRAAAPPSAASGEAPFRKVSSYGERIQIVGDTALVSGRLYNPDPRDQTVTVELALLRDGHVVERTTENVLVPGRGHQTVSKELHAGSGDGTYSGRIRVLE